MLVESSPNRLSIMKGGVTMQVPTDEVEARLSALEAYVDMPTEHTTMTVTGRLEAQHQMLIALNGNVMDLRAEFNDFRAETTRRLTSLEAGMGKALHGITAIKNLLTHPDDPTPDPGRNGSRPPSG